MIDLHQGFSGREPEPGEAEPPTTAGVVMAQLEVAAAAAKGRWKVAALQQVETWRLLGQLAGQALKQRIRRR